MMQSFEVRTALTPDELKQVQDFADFLISRRVPRPSTAVRNGRLSRIDVDALKGLCNGMGGNKSNKEVIREAWDNLIEKMERCGSADPTGDVP